MLCCVVWCVETRMKAPRPRPFFDHIPMKAQGFMELERVNGWLLFLLFVCSFFLFLGVLVCLLAL